MSLIVLRVLGIYLVVGLMAGLIAYLGNDVGRKIGRKKMSVFGMRPRHTSNFITTMTGSVIALVTLTLFAIVSEPVRQLLTGRDQLQKDVDALQSQIVELRKQRDQSRIAYGVGEPILLATINLKVGEQRLQEQVTGILGLANLQAILKNNSIAAKSGEPPLNSEEQILTYSASEVGEFTKRLKNESDVVGVRISATQNSLYRDKVPIKIETMPATLIFRKDEVVIERPLSSNHPQFLKEWYNFLDDMKRTVISKGMVEINDSLGGGLSEKELSRVSAQLDALTGTGKLVAIANRALYQTSVLDVRIEVRADASPVPKDVSDRGLIRATSRRAQEAREPLVGSRRGRLP